MRLPQRCVGSDSNVILVTEVDELSIGKVRLHFYLVHGRFDSSVREYVLKLQFNNIQRYHGGHLLYLNRAMFDVIWEQDCSPVEVKWWVCTYTYVL